MARLHNHQDRTRILVVDDNALNRVAFSTVLEGEGYLVTAAASGPEALGLATKEDFSVILLDVRMPGMDGFETAARLRQYPLARFTPIIFVSAYDQSDFQVSRGYLSGATDFIFSPVNAEFLKFKVGAFVHLRLRNEHLKEQIAHLNRVITGLQTQVDSCKDEAEAIKQEVMELRQVVAELQRELSGSSFS